MNSPVESPPMRLTDVDGIHFDMYDIGDGEPVVFVHGGMRDECFAVLQEPALTSSFRLIHYHRRGWGRSAKDGLPLSISQQAQDCRAVMERIGVNRAHLAGQSYGGTILLQFAVDFPAHVQTLSLIEPALPSVLAESPEYQDIVARSTPLLEAGKAEAALDAFFQGLLGADYAEVLNKTYPPGWFERWVADSDTIFQYDVPALEAWEFTQADAALITAPVLNMMGEHTAPFYQKTHEVLHTWLLQAESAVVPETAHAVLGTNPQGAAERIADFCSRHPLGG